MTAQLAFKDAAEMDLLRVVAAVVVPVVLSSCASALSGTHKSVRVTSDPAGALVRLDGITRGITPAVVHPSTRSDHEVTVELAGYAPFAVRLQRRHSVFLLGNVATGVFPGMSFDAATGAIYTFRPNPIHARLVPLRGEVTARERRGTVEAAPERVSTRL